VLLKSEFVLSGSTTLVTVVVKSLTPLLTNFELVSCDLAVLVVDKNSSVAVVDRVAITLTESAVLCKLVEDFTLVAFELVSPGDSDSSFLTVDDFVVLAKTDDVTGTGSVLI